MFVPFHLPQSSIFTSFSFRCVPPLPQSPLFTLSPCFATPLQLRGTTPPGCYPDGLSPLTSSPPFHAEAWHAMPLMWPWPHLPPACWTHPGTVDLRSTLGDWWQEYPLLSPSPPQPLLGGQHSVSWAHLCGAQELHLKCRLHSCLAQ